jgi:hypothetical protein
LPGRTASREPGAATIVPNSDEDKEIFDKGLEVFLNEALMLVKFSYPNIVRVRDFFRENGSAYFVMDYYEGVSLSEFVKRRAGRRPADQRAGAKVHDADSVWAAIGARKGFSAS